MKNKDREFLYDPDRKMIEERLFEGKDLKFSKQQRFQTDLSGKTYPIYSKEISMVKNNKGRRFWHFKEDNTTNYRFTVAVQARENSNYVKESNDKFKFYPNPTNKELWVQIPVSMKDKMPILNIKDLLGRVVLNKNLNNSLQSFDVQNLSSGTYILEITTINGEKLIDRFVKQ